MTTFELDGKEYELKMTRAGIREAENLGLDAANITAKPQSSLALMFFAALYSRYRVSPNKAASMLDDLLDSGEYEFVDLFETLSEQYAQLLQSGESV